MTSSLGHWPNAPLVYVLAQIQFNRVPLLEEKWEVFHQAIFDQFPEVFPENFVEFLLTPEDQEPKPQTVKRWQFFTKDRRTGIILDPGTLIFHTTDYEESNVFFDDMEVILEALLPALPTSLILKRSGLRYLDVMLPSDTLSLDAMVTDSLRKTGLEGIDCRYQHETQTIVHKSPRDSTLVVKYRQSEGGDVLPNDLFPNKLVNAPLTEKLQASNTIASSLDIDHFKGLNKPMGTAQEVVNKLRDLHTISSNAFLALTTEDAQISWKNS